MYTLSLTNILAVSVHFFISISYTSTLFTRNEPKVHNSLSTISIGTVGNTQSDYRGDMVAIELIIDLLISRSIKFQIDTLYCPLSDY